MLNTLSTIQKYVKSQSHNFLFFYIFLELKNHDPLLYIYILKRDNGLSDLYCKSWDANMRNNIKVSEMVIIIIR